MNSLKVIIPSRMRRSQISSVRNVDCVSMLVDEEFLYHDLDMNGVGSFLYETDKHGSPIMGNILIVGEVWTGDGIDFCGMSEQQFNILYPKLEELTKKAREM